MSPRVLITLLENEVAPRFDLTSEVLIAEVGEDGTLQQDRTVVLPHASAEELCHLILAEEVQVVICGAIEEEFHQYLTWKKVEVIDSVMGPWTRALDAFRKGRLEPEAVLFDRPA
jgi:predicted Fe-Mo cluster-binding NifX family protein